MVSRTDLSSRKDVVEHIRLSVIRGYLFGLVYAFFDHFNFYHLRRFGIFFVLLNDYIGRTARGIGSFRIEVPVLMYAIRLTVPAADDSWLVTTLVHLLVLMLLRIKHGSSVLEDLLMLYCDIWVIVLILATFNMSFRLGVVLFVIVPVPVVLTRTLPRIRLLLVVTTRSWPRLAQKCVVWPIKMWDHVSYFFWYELGPRFHQLLNRIEQTHLNAAIAEVSQLPGYIYKPLQKPELFRILIVERRRLFKLPRCRLEVVSLDSDSAYVACSYVWGNATLSRTICLDGCRLDITDSAYSVIRQQQSFLKERTIWIDAICINQSNTVEKSTQIGHMKEIFGRALWVDAHLKFGDSSTDLESLLAMFQTKDTDPLIKALGSTDVQLLYHVPFRQHWKRLINLVQSQWFNRVWIVQEAVLAKNLCLCYEQARIDWPQFAKSLEAMNTASFKDALDWIERSRKGSYTGGFLDRPLVLADARASTKRQSNDLFSVLRYFKGLKATDARDQVYALLGLASKEASSAIPIDYNIDLDVLLTRVMRWVLHERGLTCLLSCGTIPYQPRLQALNRPSWVRDWSTSDECLDMDEVPTWKAATQILDSHMLPQLSNLPNDRRLPVSIMTSIDSVGDNVLFSKCNDQVEGKEIGCRCRRFHHCISESLRIVRKVMHEQTDGGITALKDAYYRTLTYDRVDSDDEEILRWNRASFKSDQEIFEGFWNIDGDYEASPHYDRHQSLNHRLDMPGCESLTNEQVLNGLWTRPERYAVSTSSVPSNEYPAGWKASEVDRVERVNHRLRFISDRRIGVTARRRIANFPHDARVGDEICLIAGAAAPFVVRKASADSTDDEAVAYRQLVGWCYLYGGMDGSLATGPWKPCYLV